MSVIQFYVPAGAAQAIKIENARAVARLAGVEDRRLEYRYSSDGNGRRCRITCSVDMAVCLVAAFRMRAVEGNSSQVTIDCSYAVAAAFREIESERDGNKREYGG